MERTVNSKLAMLLCFSDSQYGELVKLAEESLDDVDKKDFNEDTTELSQRLYSILASYLKGPAAQIVRSVHDKRFAFHVWQSLRQLYAPKTRQRTLALGQTIMQYPNFGGGKSIMEQLLNFDAVLDALAPGSPKPDDLVVATVMRCVDAGARGFALGSPC